MNMMDRIEDVCAEPHLHIRDGRIFSFLLKRLLTKIVPILKTISQMLFDH